MKKSTKKWLVTATLLIFIGTGIFAYAMKLNNWDFEKLSTVKFDLETYEISERFADISIETNTADVLFMPSSDETCKVACYEDEKVMHTARVSDNTLTISVTDTRKWYEHIGITAENAVITVYLPEEQYGILSVRSDTGDIKIPDFLSFSSIGIITGTGDVKNSADSEEYIRIGTDTGDIEVENVSAKTVSLSVSTGEIEVSSLVCEGDVSVVTDTGDAELTNVRCKNLVSNGNTGDIELDGVLAKGKFVIERSTGDVTIGKSDANELYIVTETGDVEGNLLSEKVFMTQTDAGFVDVPKTVNGGKCEIITDTGSIEITVQ